MNLASCWKLPVIFVAENNMYGLSTCTDYSMCIADVADRASAYGIPGIVVDGNDVMAVYDTAQEAIKRAREGKGPSLVECKTCRVRPMSEMASERDSPDKVLPERVIEEWRKKDPVKRFTEHLLEIGALTEREISDLRRQFQKQVDEAFEFARESEYAPPEVVLGMFMPKGRWWRETNHL